VSVDRIAQKNNKNLPATTFWGQTPMHLYNNTGKRKFKNFHVWHSPPGSDFKPTHYVCLTAVQGPVRVHRIVTIIYFLYTFFIFILFIPFRPYPRPRHYQRWTTFFWGRRYAKNNFHPSSHRGRVACVLTVGLTKIWFPHTAYVLRMTNRWLGVLRYAANKKPIGINVCLQQQNSWRFKNALCIVHKNMRR